MLKLVLWLLLLFLCWPLALLALILWPVVWLISLPFRIVGHGPLAPDARVRIFTIRSRLTHLPQG
jgi:hypothetical protein